MEAWARRRKTSAALSQRSRISGTPTLAASFGFTVSAIDGIGCTGSQAYTVAIGGGAGVGDNVIAGAGLGQPSPNRVRAYRQNGSATTTDFLAYAAGQWGVNVAGADISGATRDQIVTGPGPGAQFGPQVRAFLYDGAPMGKVNYYAYGTLKYGVNVAAGNVDGDGFDEFLTGPGPGAVFGPHLRGFNFDNLAVAAMGKISFFAYATLKFGVNPASGSVDADSFAEIASGPGPGAIFGPQVRGFNYDNLAIGAIAKINFSAFTVAQFGANVAVDDADGDAYAEIGCAPGPGAGGSFPPRFKGYDYDAAAVAPKPGYDVTLATGTSYGGRVGLGDVTGDGRGELLAGAGRDATATAVVHPFHYTGGALVPLLSFDPFAGQGYGVNVASAALGL